MVFSFSGWVGRTRCELDWVDFSISVLQPGSRCPAIYLCDGHLQKSVLRISSVAVPYIFGGGQSRLKNIDRCHSLGSLLPPPAALPSLPQRATLVGLITRRLLQGLHCKPRKRKTTPFGVVSFFWQVAPKKISACLLFCAYVNITGRGCDFTFSA